MCQLHPHHPQWQPPFCPNPNCFYHNQNTHNWRFKKMGFYRRLAPPRSIQRYTCLHCRRCFSRQTFSTTYWLKRPHLLGELLLLTVGCMANRQIARKLRCAPATVDRQLARLGRHCLLFHHQRWLKTTAQGPVVVDGFESFEHSQYWPFHFNLAVETASGFFIHFTDSELRRKGRMTASQKRRRAELEAQHRRPDPRAVQKGMAELLRVVLRGKTSATIRSDDHPAYRRALQGLECEIRHEVTSSQRRRDARNPLWEVNLLDLLIRHSAGNHKRETIAWSKRRQAAAERLAVLLVWRNYMKRRWEKRCRQTPAMLKGLVGRMLTEAEVLRERLFRTRVRLPARWGTYYERQVETRALAVNRRHQLSYAF